MCIKLPLIGRTGDFERSHFDGGHLFRGYSCVGKGVCA